MKKSKIFTEGELKAIEEIKKGNRRDKFGTFYGRVKPKINELLEVWIPKKKELQKLIQPIEKRKED